MVQENVANEIGSYQSRRKKDERRYKANQKHIILWKDHKQRELLERLLREKGRTWGPDEILGRIKIELGREVVSTVTFYRFIREYHPSLQKYLRHKKWGYRTYKKGNKRKKMYQDVPNIKEMPKIVEQRKRIGDWEGDTIVSNHKVKGGLITLTERKSRYTLIKKIGNHKAYTTRVTIESMLQGEKVETITFDNGVEFSGISKLQYQCYRANTYASYERGTNEKHNVFLSEQILTNGQIKKYKKYKTQSIINRGKYYDIILLMKYITMLF